MSVEKLRPKNQPENARTGSTEPVPTETWVAAYWMFETFWTALTVRSALVCFVTRVAALLLDFPRLAAGAFGVTFFAIRCHPLPNLI